MARSSFVSSRIALACATCIAASVHAQTAPDTTTTTVTVTGRSVAGAGIGGFGDVPTARLPQQASSFSSAQLADAGIASLAGLTRLDASVGDAYNAEGYWSNLSVRGYTLDNRFNDRRDGLPINAETAIALDNKDRIELLKGTSGIQAGTSAPGGLVNVVVKRPTGHVRSASLQWRAPGAVLGAVDIGDRFGADGRFGLRVNAAAERLDAQARDTKGSRSLLAAAFDWQVNADLLLQAEVESSRQRQPSVSGFSMLGDRVPAASEIDPRLNLNRQPWGQPVVLDGDTASLRWQQRLSADWRLTVHAMQQRLKSDDRTAFPYGVYDANYDCNPCDRFASDGTFTYWQYVSDHERRTSSALSVSLAGQARTGGVAHSIEAGLLLTRYKGKFQDQIFDIAGTGRIDGSLITPPSAGGLDANTNRDERSTEVFVRDAVQLSADWQLWAGLRHTRLDRSSRRTSPAADGPNTDGFRATQYDQSATLPWLALSHTLAPRTLVYASWGQGLESDVAPNRARYVNAGQALPALKSRQAEAGIKHDSDVLDAALTLFNISRPQAADIGACSSAGSCVRAIDGTARHRGIEAAAAWHANAWLLQASALWLDAERRGASQPGVDGTRPTNVPQRTLRLMAEYTLPATTALPAAAGLALLANLTAESDRVVLPYDQTARIPGWARVDLGARWRQPLAGNTALIWRLGVDNATDRRAWKESPYQFGHAYLYPLAPRTWRGSVQAFF